MEEDLAAMADGDALRIHAGFPNPALDRINRQGRLALDLNRLLVRHPSSTYLFRISGHQWADQGIYDGDIALIDRALTAQAHDLVIAWQEGGFLLRRFAAPETDKTPWGVVSSIIHPLRRMHE